MSDCSDMTTALARELTHGIKDTVEDLSAVFKKMAILKSDTGVPDVGSLVGDTILERFMRFNETFTSLNLPDTISPELIKSFIESESKELTIQYVPNKNDIELLELAGVS